MTTAARTAHVPAYVERPYEHVCDVLDKWKDRPLVGEASPPFAIGELTRVSRWSAHAPIVQARGVAFAGTAELRVLPVHTGQDALTELLLVGDDPDGTEHAARVVELSSMLDTLVRLLDAA